MAARLDSKPGRYICFSRASAQPVNTRVSAEGEGRATVTVRRYGGTSGLNWLVRITGDLPTDLQTIRYSNRDGKVTAELCTQPCHPLGPAKYLTGLRGTRLTQSTLSASRSEMQASICFRSESVMQNMAKCAIKLSTTRNRLLGISFCSASQSAGGKNMSLEKGTT